MAIDGLVEPPRYISVKLQARPSPLGDLDRTRTRRQENHV